MAEPEASIESPVPGKVGPVGVWLLVAGICFSLAGEAQSEELAAAVDHDGDCIGRSRRHPADAGDEGPVLG